MTIRVVQTPTHWNYFLAIERDLHALSRYVEFDEKNFQCFSVEIARILLAAAAEADAVCKQLCRLWNPASKASTIAAYRTEIRSHIPNSCDFEVTIPRFGLTLHPWEEWRSKVGVPLWWTGYNKVKHHRDSDYHEANLKNALNAVAGLFVVVLYLYRREAEATGLSPAPELLMVGPAHARGAVMRGNQIYSL